ncbi:methyltransferase [Pseudomonas nicosulfuronedens]
MFPLDETSYVFNDSLSIWSRPDYPGIAYSDGDAAEQRLAAIVDNALDLSVLSSELRGHCQDWLTLYHLSSQRANVLRPFAHKLKGRILEIGAGCGAISRFLGETGGEVLALEGSPRRAAIAAKRTRDLDNVTVLAERFDDLQCDELFDAITLIGVLEYASMFSGGENPAKTMLSKVRQLLKPDGHLFIAIENQLGLKYFAGAPEDHLGQVMFGIEGRYQRGQPQTHGRHALKRLAEEAGFNTVEFLAPFPDYKVPRSIITERGSSTPGFDAAALAWQNVKSDPQLPQQTYFDLQRAWPTVFDNYLGMDLANSFIVVASPGTASAVDDSILAYHYTTERNAPFCKEATFVQASHADIRVQYRRISPQNDSLIDERFRFILPAEEPYITGRLLSQDFFEQLSDPDWTIGKIGELIQNYLRLLERLVSQYGEPIALKSSQDRLPGNFIDAVPHNIILDGNGTPCLFDIEWEADGGVELGHLLCRGLLLLLGQVSELQPPRGVFEITRQDLIERLINAAGIHLQHGDYERYLTTELTFVRSIVSLPKNCSDIWHSSDLLTSPTELQAAVYYSHAGGSFDEARSVRHPLRQGRQQISMKLDYAAAKIGQLRFDPVAASCWFILHDIRISGPDGQALWQLSSTSTPLASSGIREVLGRPGGQLLYAVNDDPQFALPVPEQRHNLVIHVDIELLENEKIAEKLTYADHQLSDSAHKLDTVQTQLDETSYRLDETTRQLDETTRQLDETSRQAEEIELARATTEQQLSEQKSRSDELNKQYHHVLSENDAIKASRTWKLIQKIAKIRQLI